jgi:hypothetical protein
LSKYYEELDAGEGESMVVARLGEFALVAHEEPRLPSSHYEHFQQENNKRHSRPDF